MNQSTTNVPAWKHNPGSPEAVAEGCTCPRLDNGHGLGWLGQTGVFAVAGNCPLHGRATVEPESDVSACCGAGVIVQGDVTHWYECNKCKQPCDTGGHTT